MEWICFETNDLARAEYAVKSKQTSTSTSTSNKASGTARARYLQLSMEGRMYTQELGCRSAGLYTQLLGSGSTYRSIT